MQLLDKAAILAANALAHEDIEVKELGGTIRVRVMTGEEREAYEEKIRTTVKAELPLSARAILARFTITSAEGALMFGDDDLPALDKLPATALDKITRVAQRLNLLRVKDLTDAEKN